MKEIEKKINYGIDGLIGCSETGAEINPEMKQWFEGYKKGCEDIKRSVIENAFNDRPIPVRWKQLNEPTGCKQK